MNNENKSHDNTNTRVPTMPTHRVPTVPLARVPTMPIHRVPTMPTHRISGDSGRFFENFTKFKNTESNWNVVGFSK